MRIRFVILLLALVDRGAIGIAQSPGTFSQTGSMTSPRLAHTATLLPDGKVLIAGGFQNRLQTPAACAQLYDPSTGAFTSTGNYDCAAGWAFRDPSRGRQGLDRRRRL
jgi:hypothetical protein